MNAGESSSREPITAARPKADRPGALRGQVWLTLQTRQALQLVRGRTASDDKPPIFGLVRFAQRLRLIWQAARDDDPWADWWLIRVHALIEAGAHHLQDRTAELEALLAREPAMDITVAGSERPSRVP
ncbi:MAG: AcaB family transcriptional regulator, partial [Gammaproteobacteria bacterium]|nr:AcaB family transcriptional regulator [Gammaproteobacteria bacterium]